MKKPKQTFGDGEVIFREGDPGDTAYEIVSGTVEISKSGGGGNVQLATLGAGKMLGEMGALDQGTRSATAIAVGPVTLNAISHKDFLAAMRDEPDLALGVMGDMVERLRGAGDKLAHGTGAPVLDSQVSDGAPADQEAGEAATATEPGFWSKLMSLKNAQRTERIEIRVAPLTGEDGAKHAGAIVRALARRKGIRTKALRKPFKVNPDASPAEQEKAFEAAARRALAGADADLLIWGETPVPGLALHLKFISFATWDDAPPGEFSPGTLLPLPIDIGDAEADFLHATVLAATVPKSEGKAAALVRDLPLALENAQALLDDMPADLTIHEKAWLRVCHANALTTVAVGRGDTSLYQRAAEAYRGCLEAFSEDETPVEWAAIQKNLGAVLQAVAERIDQEARSGGAATGIQSQEVLGEAADAFGAALKVLSMNEHPFEWAAAQNRLGEVLYRLDFESGDIEMLKHSIAAYQSALQVYTRAKTPMRWAEVMNNFAQVTQVLGEQLKNAEALEKAAQACRAALEVRTKAEVPLLWAATQNNLGSALFLLGKMTTNAAHLEGAAEAFDLAGGLYRARGMEKMAAITEKNLGRVNQLLARARPQDPPPLWDG